MQSHSCPYSWELRQYSSSCFSTWLLLKFNKGSIKFKSTCVLFTGLDARLPDFMRTIKRILPQPSEAPAKDLDVSATTLSSSVDCLPRERSASHSEPKPGTSTGGVTPSGHQEGSSTGVCVSTRCAGKRSWKGSDSSDSSSCSSSSESDDEWTPATHAQSAKKTNNPSG